MNPEEKYRKIIDIQFIKYFDIDSEVWSECGTKRIDYVLHCKRSNVLFGIEVKKSEHLRGVELGKYLLQAHNYSKIKFKTKFSNKPEKMLIFITPAISNVIKEIKPETLKIIDTREYYEAFHNSYAGVSNVNSMIGVFNVGEIKSRAYRDPKYNYFYFIYKNKFVWDSKNGLRDTNYNIFNKSL